MINWKPIIEKPSKHSENNDSISPTYLVKCDKFGGIDNKRVVGYANYSFANDEWLPCFKATERGVFKVIAWTDEEID